MKVVVSGSSGLIGTALVSALEARGDQVVRLVRRSAGDPREAAWNPGAGTIDAAAVDGADAVIHLAGAGIGDKRWTDAYKREILDSRVRGTDLLARTIAGVERRPKVLLSASAVGFYGNRGDEELDESSTRGEGFLPDVCVAWEAATAPASEAGVRVTHLRTGIVLAREGGALKKMLPLFKAAFGGRFGNGRQWMSWIHLDDEVAAILHLLGAEVTGPVNLTAPNPVTNREFTQILGSVLGRPTPLPVPKFGPSLLLGGELAQNLLYDGQRVLPRVLEASGYRFRYTTLEPALRNLTGKPAL